MLQAIVNRDPAAFLPFAGNCTFQTETHATTDIMDSALKYPGQAERFCLSLFPLDRVFLKDQHGGGTGRKESAKVVQMREHDIREIEAAIKT